MNISEEISKQLELYNIFCTEGEMRYPTDDNSCKLCFEGNNFEECYSRYKKFVNFKMPENFLLLLECSLSMILIFQCLILI